MNKVMLIGYAGGAPEVRTVGNTKVATIRIATNEKYRDKDGNTKENTAWHRVQFWNRQAEIAEKYIQKGTCLYVDGILKYDKYTDKDGVERTSVFINANDLQFVGAKKKEESGDMPEGF